MEYTQLVGIFNQINSATLRENTSLKAQISQLTTTNAGVVDRLQQQLTNQAAAHLAEKSQLQSQLETAQAQAASNATQAALATQLQTQVNALQARVASLEAIAPFDPRKIRVEAFYARMLPSETLMLLTDSDPVVQSIAELLKQWAINGWPIFMDTSPEFQQAKGYFIQSGKIPAERIAALTVDATRDEAPLP